MFFPGACLGVQTLAVGGVQMRRNCRRTSRAAVLRFIGGAALVAFVPMRCASSMSRRTGIGLLYGDSACRVSGVFAALLHWRYIDGWVHRVIWSSGVAVACSGHGDVESLKSIYLDYYYPDRMCSRRLRAKSRVYNRFNLSIPDAQAMKPRPKLAMPRAWDTY